jgi:hypothetical protein
LLVSCNRTQDSRNSFAAKLLRQMATIEDSLAWTEPLPQGRPLLGCIEERQVTPAS